MGDDDKLNELLVKCWRDGDTRKRFIANPKKMLAEHGIELPPDIDVVVVEDTATKVHVVLPPGRTTMAKTELSDAQLDAVSGGAAVSPNQTIALNPALAKLRTAAIPTSPSLTTCDTSLNSPCSALSQRRHKKDIGYLSREDERRLADELMSFRLATYHYTNESASDPRRLGFIIDDVAPSAAVATDGEHVDLYGYMTMAVATLQVQHEQIVALQKQVDDLKQQLKS
jgi:hypothetical protein